MPNTKSAERKLKVGFVHPDLGIGGAERLVVDAAVGLQSRGHSVQIFTSHHSPQHCFSETKDGTLRVQVFGDILPRSVWGKLHILFAILRSLWLASKLVWLVNIGGVDKLDVLVVDQLSASIPILKLTGAKIFFYCHFPDKLLTQRDSLLKKLYRLPVDFLEEYTTALSDTIVVNSKFTGQIFQRSFPRIQLQPEPIYPSIHFEQYDQVPNLEDVLVKPIVSNKKTILSINRFERKKNIVLAIEAFAKLRDKIGAEKFSDFRLVIAGGYDPRVEENVSYHRELQQLASSLNITHHTFKPPKSIPQTQILFLPSFTEPQRTYLLSSALCLLYTPSFEHFGIVPIEAMYSRVPVIAVNNGGPVESIEDGVTGLLVDSTSEAFANALEKMVDGHVDVDRMGENGRKRVVGMFGLDVFTDKLESKLMELCNGDGDDRRRVATKMLGSGWLVLVLVGVLSTIFTSRLMTSYYDVHNTQRQ